MNPEIAQNGEAGSWVLAGGCCWLAGWLGDCQAGWLDGLDGCLASWLAGLSDWLTRWLAGLTGWLLGLTTIMDTYRFLGWPFWLADWLAGWNLLETWLP